MIYEVRMTRWNLSFGVDTTIVEYINAETVSDAMTVAKTISKELGATLKAVVAKPLLYGETLRLGIDVRK